MERSPEARRLAELALGRLVVELGTDEVPFVVLGGLVPHILTRGQNPPAPQHLGTTDVDLQLNLSLQVEAYEGLQRLEAALDEAGFTPSKGNEGWRWETLDSGFRAQIYNSRGVTSRGLMEGGDQERELSAHYSKLAENIRPGWPRTSAILQSVADGYAAEARLHDEQVQRFREGMDR